MRLFDTRTRSVLDLHFGQTVRLYVCGITPYDSTHLGHAFTYAVFDALVRYLEHEGHSVRYARNITDVDDDILRKARELAVEPADLARREVERFDRDLARLGLRAPDVVPRATETIPAIRTAVRGLLDTGAAYTLADGRVYFDTGRAGSAWGAFSGLDEAERLRQFRDKGGDPDAPGKRSVTDFLLWQPSAPGEPSWVGPVDAAPRGRPGWHIECSAMVMEELGSVIDLHGGGDDLVFPHHEAEVLQSESLTGQGPFARAWLHVGMVALDGVKMSKSLGNLVFVRDLLEDHDPAAVRRYLLGHHYRTGWSHDEATLAEAARSVAVWREVARRGGETAVPEVEARFHAAMNSDLDVPEAIAALDEAAARDAGDTLARLAGVLGFDLAPVSAALAE